MRRFRLLCPESGQGSRISMKLRSSALLSEPQHQGRADHDEMLDRHAPAYRSRRPRCSGVGDLFRGRHGFNGRAPSWPCHARVRAGRGQCLSGRLDRQVLTGRRPVLNNNVDPTWVILMFKFLPFGKMENIYW